MSGRLLLTFLLVAVTTSALAQTVGDPVAGQRVAETICSECHAVRAEQKFSPNLDATPFAEAANKPGMSAMALRVWLQSPHETMPNIILSQQDTDDVIAYILRFKGR